MKSYRRALELSLALVTLMALPALFVWERWPELASTRDQPPAQSDLSATTANENGAATADPPEESLVVDAAVADASPKVDFSGQWQLNVEASDSLDPILKAIGLSIFERTLVNNTVVTHIINQTADEFTIEVKTAFFSRVDRLPLNGEPTQTTDPGGRPVESISHWSDDATRLITKIWVKPEKQKFTMTRSIDEDREAMEVLIEFFPKEGKPMTSRRVYRRVGPAAASKSS